MMPMELEESNTSSLLSVIFESVVLFGRSIPKQQTVSQTRLVMY